jgi:hypothetical protein
LAGFGVVLALLVGLLTSISGAGSATAEPEVSPASVNPQLLPASGQTAIRRADRVTFGGNATFDGQACAACTLQSAFLRTHDRTGAVTHTWDVVADGAISFTAGSFGGQENTVPSELIPPNCEDDGSCDSLDLQATVVYPGGVTQTGDSSEVPIDVTPPSMLGGEFIDPETIKVNFSEAVFPVDGRASDWQVDGAPPIAVTGTGAVRLLQVPTQDEDAQPLVNYRCFPQVCTPYVDRAGQVLDAGSGSLAFTAVDKYAPVVPTVDMIGGHNVALGSSTGNDNKPVIHLTNIRSGNTATVWLERDGASGENLDPGHDLRIGQPTADQFGASTDSDSALGAAGLGPDGPYTFCAIATDPHGNPSVNPGCAAYVLDTVAPTARFAFAEGNQVRVRFSEAVAGQNSPLEWQVSAGGPVTGVSGTGDTRLLDVASPVPPGSMLTWTPSAGSYADAAGNAMAQFTKQVGNPVPVVDVTVPNARVYTRDATFTISGTTDGATIELFRDRDNNGTADGRIDEVPASGGTWSFHPDLDTDRGNDFLVRASKTEGGSRIDGLLTDVPTIVQDSIAPSATLTAPSGGEVVSGNGTMTITWTASDANLGQNPIDIDYSTDGGTSWSPISHGETNDGSYDWTTVPDGVNTSSARVRIIVTDLAGWTTEKRSGAFTIDSLAPLFGARTLDPTHVLVRFTEGVRGSSGATDWRIDNIPVSAVNAGPADPAGLITELTLTSSQSLGGNSHPQVTYGPLPVGGNPYVDRAGNAIPDASRTAIAEDGIAPGTPAISQIAGTSASGGTVVGNDPTPQVQVTNVTSGDEVFIYVESGDGAPGLTNNDPLVGHGTAGNNGATIDTSNLGEDATYTLYATAKDGAGNTSPGAGSATYRLDTLVPRPLFAVTDGSVVTVTFDEPIAGLDNPLDWHVSAGGPVLGVSGTGDTRVLTAPAVPIGAAVSWAASPLGGYSDAAGNVLAGFSLPVLGEIPPLVTLTNPTAKVWAKTASFNIQGTATSGDRVEVFNDANGDRQPDGGVVASASVSGNTFTVSTPLASDAENHFLIRGVKTAGNVQGPFTVVPTIVQDSHPPDLSLSAPAGGEYLAGGFTFTIRWTASDTNLRPGPIDISHSEDGGMTWSPVTTLEPNTGFFDWTIPNVNSTNEVIRIDATDRAGWVTEVISQPFTIDSLPPVFTAKTVDRTHVLVTFSEPVSGSVAAGEWFVAGFPVVGATPSSSIAAAAGPTFTTISLETDGGVAPIGPNDTPLVEYVPASEETVYVDRAGFAVPKDARSVTAADGIAPAPIQLGDYRRLVKVKQVTLTGTGSPSAGDVVVAKRTSPSDASFQGAFGGGDHFSIALELAPDLLNTFELRASDPAGNLSPPVSAQITHDGTKPKIKFVKVKPFRGKGGRLLVRIRWADVEPHRGFVRIKYRVKGTRVFRAAALKTPDDGVFKWQPPRSVIGKFVRVRLVAVDQLGHKAMKLSKRARIKHR